MVSFRSFASIYLDTAPFIYFIEGFHSYLPVLDKLFAATHCRRYTSVVSVMEVLPKPVAEHKQRLVDNFLALLSDAQKIVVVDLDFEIAEYAGRLRGKYPALKGMDALQLATAVHVGADVFITNDYGLKKITEIKVMVLDDLTDTK